MKTTVNVIFPSDRLVDGKLWLHFLQGSMDKYKKPYTDHKIYESLKLAISQSVPFAKECIEEIENTICRNHFDGNLLWKMEPDKLYSFEFDGEVKIEDDIVADGGVALTPKIKQFAVLVPAQAREESQEDLVTEIEYTLITEQNPLKVIQEKFHITRK